jgi:hypothetical protein
MSIRQWSSFLEQNCCIIWQQRAINLMYEIEDDISSAVLSLSSSISTNESMTSDSDNNHLVNEFHVAIHNANEIAIDLVQTVTHPNITWYWKCGLTIDALSSDDALTFFDSGKHTYKKGQTSFGRDCQSISLAQMKKSHSEMVTIRLRLKHFCF